MIHIRTAQIDRHVNSLVKLCNLTGENAHEKASRLYARLRSIERYAQKSAEDYCNIPNFNIEKSKSEVDARVKHAFSLVNSYVPEGFFFNLDPRGYALKIESESLPDGFYKDWGGYGILAPEF